MSAPRTHVFLYEPQFAALVESGAKLCTIRRRRFGWPQPGELLDHRKWVGVPYRSTSQQVTICKTVCASARGITIDAMNGRVTLDGDTLLTHAQADRLARDDGFADKFELFLYFATCDGRPWHGVLITWKK